MDAPQLALPGFEPPAPPTPTATSGRVGSWLYGLRLIMQGVLEGPAMRDVLTVACLEAAGSRHGWHDRVEDEVAALLESGEAQAMVSTAVDGGRVFPGFGQVRAVTWERLSGKHAPADFVLTVAAEERTVAVPVNLKADTPGTPQREDRACAATALVRAARAERVVGERLGPDDVDTAALSWFAGQERIRGDYYVWQVYADHASGEVAGTRCQGLLSTVVDGPDGPRLAVRRQGSRNDGVIFVPSDRFLPDGWDPNLALARALMRPPSRHAAAVLALSLAAADGADDAALAELAGNLLAQL